MAFSSFPAIYFDHPNSQQFQDHHHQHGSGGERSQIISQPPPTPTIRAVAGATPDGGGGSSIRAKSMIDLARQAQVPPPVAGLKCPRCDSSNTKFCYYNNYNLLQPRYMCKSCRRYWTKGGAIRNVPVGGGCRKNKKTKNTTTTTSSSKSSTTISSDTQIGTNNSTATTTPCITHTTNFPQFPMMDTLRNNITHYSGGPSGRFPVNMGFNLEGNANDLSSTGGAETWRLSLIRGNMSEGHGASSSSMIGNHQLGSMAVSSGGVISPNLNGKLEENPGENITRDFYINSDIHGQFWSDHENPWIGF